MTYEEACEFLFTRPRMDPAGVSSYRSGVRNIERLLQRMGNPHRSFPSVHVAGSNGKGSTSSMIAAISSATGRKTGLHTSPHLFSFTERMRIDGEQVNPEWVAARTTEIQSDIIETGSSFFEASVALAFQYFCENEVDLAVIEVGLGGRLDATNVVVPVLSVITRIAMDHTRVLGDTLEVIAREKAGIIKAGVPVVTSECRQSVVDVLKGYAAERGCHFHQTCGLSTDQDDDLVDVELDLPGAHQEENAMLAACAAGLLFRGESVLTNAVKKGLGQTKKLSGLRARCEILGTEPLIVADVAHNPDGLAATLRFVQSLHDQQAGTLYVLFGVMRDKDVESMARQLVASDAVVFPADLETHRGLAAVEIARVLNKVGGQCLEHGSVDDGLRWFEDRATEDDSLLIVGSHYLVGALPRHLFPTL